jgi:AmiR/NasT family two-component response regulator
MPLAQRSIGGLNIYQTAEGGFSPAFREHAEVFAGYAAVAVNNIASYAGATAEVANLRTAMRSRAAIEQAKGILMARDRCTPDEAFDMLRRISQHRNLKLHDVAQTVVDSVHK